MLDNEMPETDIKRYHVNLRPTPIIDGERAKLVDMSEEYMALYVPGHTVYIDSVTGTQYKPGEIFFVHIDEVNGSDYWVTEILRFPRSAI